MLLALDDGQLDVDREGFKAVSGEYGGMLQIVACFHDGYPGFGFGGDITERLGRHRLELDFDLYMLRCPRRHELTVATSSPTRPATT